MKHLNQTSQQGIASIVVTMIMMIVITLMVVVAARLSRREQIQAFDSQLSTQAYYAAESGVNDAVKAIEADATLLDHDRVDNCDEFIAAPTVPLQKDLSPNVKYTCLLVDPTPGDWVSVVGSTSRSLPLQGKNNAAISTIEIAWQDKDGSSEFGGCPSSTTNLPAVTDWDNSGCRTPMLRFDIVPTQSVTRNSLNSNVMSGFLFPSSSSVDSDVPYVASAIPIKQTIACTNTTAPKFCKATISGLGTTSYFLRLRSLYGSSDVSVSAFDTAHNRLELRGAQVVVDSTGKAADVLRRIQVRIPLSGQAGLADFAIQSGDNICKQLNVGSSFATSANPECPLD